MQVHTHSDNSIDCTEALKHHVESVVADALARFGGQITRVEAHLSAANAQKSADGECRCGLEARLAGHQPVAVNEHAATLHQAIQGAADKLKNALEHTLGKLAAGSRERPVIAQPTEDADE